MFLCTGEGSSDPEEEGEPVRFFLCLAGLVGISLLWRASRGVDFSLFCGTLSSSFCVRIGFLTFVLGSSCVPSSSTLCCTNESFSDPEEPCSSDSFSFDLGCFSSVFSLSVFLSVIFSSVAVSFVRSLCVGGSSGVFLSATGVGELNDNVNPIK